MIWLVAISIFLGLLAWGPLVSRVEHANYKVISSTANIEQRDYEALLIAQTIVQGEREEAINRGFKLIAAYIFGDNQHSQKIAMTAPVMQQTINNQWRVCFVMPAGYTLNNLPKPRNELITIKTLPKARFAVIRFSGLASAKQLQTQQQLLMDYLTAQQLTALSDPIMAFFNPPWTAPFLRRNEIMIEIAPY